MPRPSPGQHDLHLDDAADGEQAVDIGRLQDHGRAPVRGSISGARDTKRAFDSDVMPACAAELAPGR